MELPYSDWLTHLYLFVEYDHSNGVVAGLPLPGFPEEEPLIISTIKSSVNFVLMTRKGNRQQVCVLTDQGCSCLFLSLASSPLMRLTSM